ncbi:hypothetical protein [Sphingomonas sp. 3-13AW]|uniref:hypothetical protein n=1 Tax=Sphingomonas sp. 3-13AW TaxID=3050450 RepID=UPI003BB64E59
MALIHAHEFLVRLSQHGLRGGSLASLFAIAYGAHTGQLGDAFVSYANELGAPIAIIIFTAMVLAAFYGAMLVIAASIALAVSIVRTFAPWARHRTRSQPLR